MSSSPTVPAAEAAPAPEPEPEPEPEPQPQAAAPASAGDKPDSAAPDFQATIANPTAWWNLLQEQFQQAVGNVLADQPPAGKEAKTPAPAAQKKTTKAKPAAKPRTRAKSTVVQSGKPKPAPRKPKSP